MNKKMVGGALCMIALVGGIGAFALAQGGQRLGQVQGVVRDGDDDDTEEVISFADAPEAVRSAALRLVAPAGEQAITQVEREVDDGQTIYGIEYNKNGQGWSADISTSGEVSDLEQEDQDDGEDEDEGEDD